MLLKLLFILGFLPLGLSAMNRANGWCEQGAQVVVTPNTPNSTTKVQRSFPSCTVRVYDAGTTNLATIFADSSSTPLANPFTSMTTGSWGWYAANGSYDVQLSGGGISSPFTIYGVWVYDSRDEFLSVKDFGAVGDGTHDDTSAFQAAVDSGQGLLIPNGTYKISSQINITRETSLYCFSKQSIIHATNALSGFVFHVVYDGEGFEASGCTFDMTSAGAQGVFYFSGVSDLLRWPQVTDSKFLYPALGTGTAIYAQKHGFMQLSRLYWINPGMCVDMQGDGGMEDQIIDSRCDGAKLGIRQLRTTAPDVGGLYIINVQVTNSPSRSDATHRILIQSTYSPATPMPTELTQVVGDTGFGNGLTVINASQVSVVNSWFATANGEAIHLETAGEFRAVGNHNFQGVKGVAFYGSNTSVMITNNKVFGSGYTFWVDPGATLSGIQIGNNVVDWGTDYSNNLAKIVHSLTPSSGPPIYGALSSSGLSVLVDDTFVIDKNSLRLCTIKSGVTLPCKFITVNNPGNLVFFGNDAGANQPTATITIVDPANTTSGRGGLSIAGGDAITLYQSATVASLGFGTIAANSCTDIAGINYTGAATGDTLQVTPSATLMNVACTPTSKCLTATGFITSANTITLRVCNASTHASAATGTVSMRVDVVKHNN